MTRPTKPSPPVTSTALMSTLSMAPFAQESPQLMCSQLCHYRINFTNSALSRQLFPACYAHSALAIWLPLSPVAIQTNNLRRLLHTVEALSELGPTLTAEREFSETSRLVLSSVMEAAGAR